VEIYSTFDLVLHESISTWFRSVVPNFFVVADWSTLDKFTAARQSPWWLLFFNSWNEFTSF